MPCPICMARWRRMRPSARTRVTLTSEELLRGERDARRVRAREMLTRIAGFPAIKTLEAFDFTFATGAPRQKIQELAGPGFVERAENVILLGPSGVGKTHVSTATPDPRPRGKSLGCIVASQTK